MHWLQHVLLLALCFPLATHAASPTLKLQQTNGTWLVRIVDSADAAIAVTVDTNQPDLPPLLGSFEAQGSDRVFRARFPLQPGMRYSVSIASTPPTVLKFSIPIVQGIATRILAVYPSANSLPENQLKFYIHFSSSMARGDAYRWIRLLDERGQRIDVPFLELGEELWDPENKRLTLYFDPGRVKSDLLPGREMGAPLRAGRSYTLELDAGWPDAHGQKIDASFKKSFRVVAADHTMPDPKLWRVRAPRAATIDPLIIEFPEPLDHALLLRMVEVLDAKGSPLVGQLSVDRDETRLQFRPTTAWSVGSYSLRANTALEDLAGNKLNRPFEFEGARTPTQRTSATTISIPFKPVIP